MAHPLEYIIRNVKSDTLPSSSDEFRLVFDPRNRKVLDKKPMVSIWSFEYYLINFRKSAICKGLTQKINDFSTNRSINLHIDYEASLTKSNSKVAVLALSEGDSTGDALDNILKEEVLGFCGRKSKEGVDVITQFYQSTDNNNTLKKELQNFLENLVSTKTGLNIKIALEIENNKRLRTIEVRSREFFTIRVNDYDDKLKLSFEAKLEINKENRINAILHFNSTDELRKIIQTEVSKYILKEVSLHDFYYKLNKSVKKKIQDKLDLKLKKYGRQILVLVFEFDKSSIKPEELPITNYDVACEIKEYPDPVTVKNRVSMHISNLGKFKNADIKDLKKWVGRKLTRITKDTLLYKTYTDILLETDSSFEDSYENIIKSRMREEVDKIGYTIEQLLVIPKLKPLKLKDGFKIDKTGSYFTNDKGVSINLETIINGKILDLNQIEKYLNPKINIKSVIKNTASDIVERIINKTTSHRAYMEFHEGNNSVKNELVNAIEEKLLEEFHITDLSVIIKSLETPISIRYKELRKKSNEFSFAVIPSTGEGYFAQAVSFNGDFTVLGVTDWATFQAKDFKSAKKEVKAMAKSLETGIKKKLRLFSGEVLQSSEPQTINYLEENVKNYAKEIINTEFGVDIEVLHFDRGELLSEREQVKTIEGAIKSREKLKQGNNTLILGSSHQQLKSLLQREKELVDLGYGDDYKKLVKVRKKIKKMTVELPDSIITNNLSDGGDKTKHLPSGIFSDSKKQEADKKNNNQ